MKKTYIVVASAIMILFCLMYSVSYAYFSIKVTNNFNGGNTGSTVIGSDTVKDIIISDGTKVTSSNVIPGESVTSNFTVQNPNGVSLCFGFVWSNVVNEFTRTSDLVVSLKDENGEVLIENVEFPSDNDTTFIEGLSVPANTTRKYTLTVTYKNTDEDQSVDMNKKFQATLTGKLTECKKQTSGIDTITNLVKDADSSSTDVITVSDKTSDSCTYTLAYDGTTDNNLRYVGKNPCNYVTFNGETAGWRIIGVLNTPEGQRLKLIRANSIGDLSWDSTSTGSYTNDWTTSSLQTLLNSGAYYNRTTGQYYNGSTTATTLDFTSNGLTEEARNQIDTITWKLGGTSNYNSTNTIQFYTYERGTTVYTGRPTEWQGKVGLMYPSDYGYATSGGSTSNRTSCLNKELYNWDSSSYSDCKNNDWLYNSSAVQWTLAPYSSDSYGVFYVYAAGSVYNSSASYQYAVRPSVYLLSETSIVSGEGTPDDPYEIG